MLDEKPKVFVGYSSVSHRWKSKLLEHFSVLERTGLVGVWSDENLEPGDVVVPRIHRAIDHAEVAIVLVCGNALKSPFIRNFELPYLKERWEKHDLKVVPVICEECDWKKTLGFEWLDEQHAVPRLPDGLRSLADLSDEQVDRQMAKLAASIARHLSDRALASLSQPERQTPRVDLGHLPLLEVSGLIGREQEIAMLDIAFARQSTSLATLVAGPGVGKTALLGYWLARNKAADWHDKEQIFGWSFYSQGTADDRPVSADPFFEAAKSAFGLTWNANATPNEKGVALGEAVVKSPTVLVLDGLEPLQLPNGVFRVQAQGIKALLRTIVHSERHSSFCVVTTRTEVSEIRPQASQSSAAVVQWHLDNLTMTEGAALLHKKGATRAGRASIADDHPLLFGASRRVGGHALTLSLLGRYLAKARGGDVQQVQAVGFVEVVVSADEHAVRMLEVFEQWFTRTPQGRHRLAVLRLMGLFDRPVGDELLSTLLAAPVIPGLTEIAAGEHPLNGEDWNEATGELTELGLLASLGDVGGLTGALDCHPLIRAHFAKRLRLVQPAAWQQGHTRVYQHFCTQLEHTTSPEGLSDLLPWYQAVAHGCEAGFHSEVLERVFRQRLHAGFPPAFARLGTFGEELAALERFFTSPYSDPRPGLSPRDRGFVTFETAYAMRALNRPLVEVTPLIRDSIEAAVADENWNHAAMRSGELSQFLLMQGGLGAAEDAARAAVDHAIHASDRKEEHLRRSQLATVLHHRGSLQEALEQFALSEEMQKTEPRGCEFLPGYRGFTYCLALLDEGRSEDVVRRARWAFDFECQLPNPSPLNRGFAKLSMGEAHLQLGDCESANQDLTAALSELEASGRHDHLPRALIALSRCSRLVGSDAAATQALARARQICAEGGFRLLAIDCEFETLCALIAGRPSEPSKAVTQGGNADLDRALAIFAEGIKATGYHRFDSRLKKLLT